MINIVKIGGNVIDDPELLDTFLRGFAAMEGAKVLVHGGGKEASRLSRGMGIDPVMIGGRRVTDRPTLDIVTMVYAGLINKRIVAMLQSMGCNAVGLSGADGNVIPARRRSPEPVDYGYVGDIDPAEVDAEWIGELVDSGRVPVFCALCHDRAGSMLNCNADSIAAAVAQALSRKQITRLTYCFEKPGVLADIDDDSSVIPLVTPEIFTRLKADGTVGSGMLPKLENALLSASHGVGEVRICRAEDLGGNGGTFIRLD